MTEREVGPAFPKALGAVVFVAAVVGTGAVAYRIERANERWKIEMDPLTKYRIRYRDMRAWYHQRLLDASDLGGFVFDLWDEIQRANPSEARTGHRRRAVAPLKWTQGDPNP